MEKRERLEFFKECVKKEVIVNGVFYKKAKFKSFCDGLFSYCYSNHSLVFEFNVICEDFLLDKMTIKELLDLKNIKHFNFGIYDRKTLNKIASTFYTDLHNIDILNELSDAIDNAMNI